MREILFRGKRKDNGEWEEGYIFDDGMTDRNRLFVGGLVITDYKGTSHDRYEVGLNFYEVDPETVGQFTGEFLNQRTFEGDVLNITDKYGKSKNWVVVFKDGSFMLKQEGVDFFAHFTDFPRKHYHKVVIGNIHDNPELLQKMEGGA